MTDEEVESTIAKALVALSKIAGEDSAEQAYFRAEDIYDAGNELMRHYWSKECEDDSGH